MTEFEGETVEAASVAETEPDVAEPEKPKRFGRLRRYAQRFDMVGVIVGLLFFVMSLTPSLLPRGWIVQGLISGISLAIGYGVGALLGYLARLLRVPKLEGDARRIAWLIVAAVAVIVVPVILWLGSAWQTDVRNAVQLPSDSRFVYSGVLVVAVLLAMGLLGLGRLLHRASRALGRLLGRWIPLVAARIIGGVVVAALAWGFVSGVILDGLGSLANETFSVNNNITQEGVKQPTASELSGSPQSDVSWGSLGREGRTFVSSGPTTTEITNLTGRPAIIPIRAYAGLDSASSTADEAALVLKELKRTDAFSRAVLAVGTSTGSGWISPWESAPLEYMYGGNTAIASMQYSYLPSWISFLVDKDEARTAGRTLFTTIHDYWATLPADHRPKLVVFGESLGTFGGSSAFTSVDQVTSETDGALFTGPPNSTTEWQQLTADRNSASPERLPVWGDGQTIRFAATPTDLNEPDGTLSHPKVVYMQHGSDPIVWWSPKLILNKPDWLKEAKAPDVVSQVKWLPFVTFWQLTADQIASTAPPAGFGHDYGSEVITGWNAILHPAGWTDANTEALAAYGVKHPTS